MLQQTVTDNDFAARAVAPRAAQVAGAGNAAVAEHAAAQRRHRGGGGLVTATALLLGALVAAALAALAFAAWQREAATLTPPGSGRGALVGVVLLNGQIYYGNVVATNAHQVTLENVYYVQTDVDPAANQRSNRLVRRQRVDWHAPVRTTIGADKILMVEAVGPGSRLQQLVEQDTAQAAAAPH